MSNPCINRWGINTFWHNFWYSDNHYSYNLKQDDIFTKLLAIYLFHGITLPKMFFSHKYWYAKNAKSFVLPTYFRLYNLPKIGDKYKPTCIIRQTKDSTFLFKLFIIKYDTWIIINQTWFKPHKKKPNQIVIFDKSPKNIFKTKLPDEAVTLKKIQTLYSVKFFNYIMHKSYYQF